MLCQMQQTDLIRKMWQELSYCMTTLLATNRMVQNGEALVILSPAVEGMLLNTYIQLRQATNINQLERYFMYLIQLCRMQHTCTVWLILLKHSSPKVNWWEQIHNNPGLFDCYWMVYQVPQRPATFCTAVHYETPFWISTMSSLLLKHSGEI